MSDGPSVERRAVWGRSHWGPAAVVYWLYQGHQSVPTEGVATAPKENACVLQANSFCPKWLCATICPLTGLKAGPIHRLATLPCPRSENDLAIQMAWFRNLACVDRAFRWEQNHRKETSGECSAAGCLGLSSIPHGLLVWPLGAPAQTSMSSFVAPGGVMPITKSPDRGSALCNLTYWPSAILNEGQVLHIEIQVFQ